MQPIADVLKLLSKEEFTPATAVPWMMAIAPVISVITAVATMAIIPFGPFGAWGGGFGLYGIDVSIGLLYFFAFGSLAFYGLMLGGWSSGSKYSFLGAMRAAAQLISYEVALGLSLLGVVMTAGSLSLVDDRRGPGRRSGSSSRSSSASASSWWPASPRPRARRSTCPRATPRSSAATTPSSAGCASARSSWPSTWRSSSSRRIAAACFLGGWHGPGPVALAPALDAAQDPRSAPLFFIWVRASLPRLRYDQLMSFGWKVLLPLATLNVLVTAIVLVVT